MSHPADPQFDLQGKSSGISNHNHDLIHELSRRLDSLWRYDQYLANAAGHPDAERFWRGAIVQERENIGRLKAMIREHVQKDCF
jgi:hypothetical protein